VKTGHTDVNRIARRVLECGLPVCVIARADEPVRQRASPIASRNNTTT